MDWFGSSGVWKMVVRVSSADSFSVSMLAKGLSGAGFWIAVSKFVRVSVAASTYKGFGMGTGVENHLMVFAMISARVSMMNAW